MAGNYPNDEVYKYSKIKAWKWYIAGVTHKEGLSHCGEKTAGYGAKDSYGFFEFPLKVCQDTGNIIPRNNIGEKE